MSGSSEKLTDVFTLHRGWFGSRPTAEILRNGEPFWEEIPEAKDHFSFGRRKAILILSCLDTIRDFHDSDGARPDAGEANPKTNAEPPEEARVRNLSGFKLKGRWVDRPYLEIRDKQKRIGLGMMKARAVLELEGEIRRFVAITRGY